MLNNKLIVLVGALILSPFLSMADEKILECQSPVLKNGFRVTVNVFRKMFAPEGTYFEYCSCEKGIVNIAIGLEDAGNTPQGVAASFLEAEGAFRGTLERKELDHKLGFSFEAEKLEVNYLVPALKLTGTDPDHITGTLCLFFNSDPNSKKSGEKYRDVELTCMDLGGILHQCDIWPRN